MTFKKSLAIAFWAVCVASSVCDIFHWLAGIGPGLPPYWRGLSTGGMLGMVAMVWVEK
jgi:hypothetical protein